MSSDGSLEAYRGRIDAIDAELVKLLNERTRVVLKIGKLKADQHRGVLAPDREKAVYDRVCAGNPGPLTDACLRAIYRELMSGALVAQKPLQIAFLGPPGTFTHQAAKRKFGEAVEYRPSTDIRGVFDEVAREHRDYGVVPVENSGGGAVQGTLDMFPVFDVTIVSEILLRIEQHLIARPGTKTVRRIYSKPEAFTQCRDYLAENHRDAEFMEVASTAKAAELAAVEENAAALGSEEAATIYGMEILDSRVEDTPGNTTRFLVLGRHRAGPTGTDKTTLMVSIKDEVGALHNLLDAFHNNGINLCSIESRPSRRKAWDYYFIIDCEGHCEDADVRKTLEGLREHCADMRVLGSYPRAERLE
jgi:chorismate mutase/prephenate dehydratase